MRLVMSVLFGPSTVLSRGEYIISPYLDRTVADVYHWFTINVYNVDVLIAYHILWALCLGLLLLNGLLVTWAFDLGTYVVRRCVPRMFH